jgi:hypothetical protein
MSSQAAAPASRRLPNTKPLLPLKAIRPPTSCHYLGDHSLASNASLAPMQAFKITTMPSLHESAHRINLRTDMSLRRYKKENEVPRIDNYGVSFRPAHLRSNSLRLASGSLHQRAYHHEPYPASLNSSGSVSPSPTELFLPPFYSPGSPKLKLPVLHTKLPAIPESRSFWLVMYFCFNLGLTLYNKGVLVSFPFPYTLSALHALFGTIGGTMLAQRGYFVPSRLNLQEALVVAIFSVLYATNIVVSNVSLQLVTVPVSLVVKTCLAVVHSNLVPSSSPCGDPHLHYLLLRPLFRRSK